MAGADLANSSCWREGGVSIWGEFEIVFDRGVLGEHTWSIHADPAGCGFAEYMTAVLWPGFFCFAAFYSILEERKHILVGIVYVCGLCTRLVRAYF
ncbi:MAG: hypothetical protein PHT88_04950 [Candidatus Moranbacteria bacterium]|nr:hypothetical protein [Candidatus Moranbacteria bacterium]